MHKKLCVLLAGVLGASALLTGCSDKSAEKVPVQSVSMITGYSSMGMYDRFAGIVEAGETVAVTKGDTMEVKEVKVKVGDTVKIGDVLFTYNTESLSLDLEKKQLELEQLKNTLETQKSQITALEKEKAKVPSSEQLDYTLQIQALQITVKEGEYSISTKEKEIERSKAVLADADVTATVDGTISEINTENAYDDYGNPKPFMSITQSGEFRIKGKVNEQNVRAVQEGAPVIVRSRVGEESWKGTISQVDLEHPITGGNNYYYDSGSDEMSSSNNYPFYIQLEENENLMLGQHVYIEPDLGQDEQEAFYLPSNFVVDADGDAYVWAANGKDELERRSVTLGTFDEELSGYEILGGLELSDYIADPSEKCEEGAGVEYYDEDSFNNGEDIDPADGADPMGDIDPADGVGSMDGVGSIDGSVIGGELTGEIAPAETAPETEGAE